MKNKIVSFNSKFGKPEKFNSQFHMVKIYVAYSGKNRNGSYISKETFEKMIPSLYGVPVVGEWKGEDFGTHGGKVEISEDGVEFIDTTKPYGYVDSSSDVKWENVVEEDGKEREYLTTTAYLWTSRYPEALEVLNNKCNQSMEINVYNGCELEEDSQYFEILDGEFSALCILGEDVEPCFESAKVSQFGLDKDKFKSEFNLMVRELKESLDKGGEDVADIKEGKNQESMFTTYNQKREALRNALDSKVKRDDDGIIVEEKYYYVADFDDTYVYVERSHWKDGDHNLDYGRFEYSFDEKTIEATISGEFEEMILTWLTIEESNQLEEKRSDYDNLKSENTRLQDDYKLLESEVVELREFKAQKDKEEFKAKQEQIRQGKIDHINNEYVNISEDTRELFISKVDEYETIEDIDADICVYIVKNKVSFSKIKDNSPSNVKVGVERVEKEIKTNPYEGLF